MTRPLAYDPFQSFWLQSQHAIADIPINQMPLEQPDAVLEYQKEIFKTRTPDIPPNRQGFDRRNFSKKVRDMVYHRPNPMGCELTLDPNYDYCKVSEQAVLEKEKSLSKKFASTYMPVGRETHVTKDAIQAKGISYRWVNDKYSKRLVPDFEPRGIVLHQRKCCSKADNLCAQVEKYNREGIDKFNNSKEVSNKVPVRSKQKHIYFEKDNKRVVDKYSDKTFGLEPFHPDIAKKRKRQKKQPNLEGDDGMLNREIETGASGGFTKTSSSRMRGKENLRYEANQVEPMNFDEFTRTTKYKLHDKIQKSVAFGKNKDEELGPQDLSLRTTKVYRSDPTERSIGRDAFNEAIEENPVLIHESNIKKKKEKKKHIFGENLVSRTDGMHGLKDEHVINTTEQKRNYEFKPFVQRAMSNIKEAVDERMRNEVQLQDNTRMRKKKRIKQVAVNKKHEQDHFQLAEEAFATTSKAKRSTMHQENKEFDKRKIKASKVHDIEKMGRSRRAYTRKHGRMPKFNNTEDASLAQEITA